MERGGRIYVITNKEHTVLYTGVTSNIISRIWDRKNKTYPTSFSSRYNCNKLIYYLFYHHIEEAIAAEKLLKGGNREAKIKLVNELNPDWKDLYFDLLENNKPRHCEVRSDLRHACRLLFYRRLLRYARNDAFYN